MYIYIIIYIRLTMKTLDGEEHAVNIQLSLITHIVYFD